MDKKPFQTAGDRERILHPRYPKPLDPQGPVNYNRGWSIHCIICYNIEWNDH